MPLASRDCLVQMWSRRLCRALGHGLGDRSTILSPIGNVGDLHLEKRFCCAKCAYVGHDYTEMLTSRLIFRGAQRGQTKHIYERTHCDAEWGRDPRRGEIGVIGLAVNRLYALGLPSDQLNVVAMTCRISCTTRSSTLGCSTSV
jgi:hypothetical protein